MSATHWGLSLNEIEDLLDSVCAIANLRSIFFLWRPMASDPDDDFLIDLAVEAQADFIVSFNKKICSKWKDLVSLS